MHASGSTGKRAKQPPDGDQTQGSSGGRGTLIVAVIVALIGALGVVAAAAVPEMLNRNPDSSSGQQKSHGSSNPAPTIASPARTGLAATGPSAPSPSAQTASPHLIEHTYGITLSADWGIPSIQSQEKASNVSEQAPQDLFYRMAAREFVSLDGGMLAFPSAAPASYATCKQAKTTPSISIKSQQYQPFCFIASDGTIAVIRIVQPMPNITLAWNPDPVNLEIMYWTQSASTRVS